jgi:hypothetical protein
MWELKVIRVKSDFHEGFKNMEYEFKKVIIPSRQVWYNACKNRWVKPMSTSRHTTWHNYDIIVEPVELKRRLHYSRNYLPYGTGQSIGLLISFKAVNNRATNDTVICKWRTVKLAGDIDENRSGQLTLGISPPQSRKTLIEIEPPLEYPAKYAFEVGIKGTNDLTFEIHKPFIINVLERMDFWKYVLELLAIVISIFALIISVTALFVSIFLR